MSNSTKSPDNKELNKGQQNTDDMFDFERRLAETPSQDDVARGLAEFENLKNDAFDAAKNKDEGNSKDIEDASRDLNNQESNGTWRDNASGGGGKKKRTDKVRFWRRAGIFGGVGGIIGIALFIISGFLPIGGLLLNLEATATGNFDMRSHTLSKRFYKVMDSMISGTEACDTTKALCRLKTTSYTFLDRLNEQGITPLDKAGNPIVTKGKTGYPDPDSRAVSFKFNGETIKAPDLMKNAVDTKNIALRTALGKAVNTRYVANADSFANKYFFKPLGIDRSGKTTNSIDEKDPQKSIKSLVDGSDVNNKVANATDEASKESALSDEIANDVSNEATKATKKFAKAGDPILIAGAVTCTALTVPGTITKISRAYQMRQEILLATTLVLTAASMIKAGDMPPQTMAVIGTLLTATAVLANSQKSASAMDSGGMRSILFKDNISPKTDAKLARFAPGYTSYQQTKTFSQIDAATKPACDAIESPEAQVAVNAGEAALAGTGVGAVIVAAVKGVGFIVASDFAIQAAMPLITGAFKAIIANIPADVLDTMFGNAALENAKNEDLGYGVAGGLMSYYPQMALATGSGAPMTVDQVAADENSLNQQAIAYAEEDRQGRSPFDISSPNTFLGSIVSNLYQNGFVPGNVSQTIFSSIGYSLSQPLKVFNTKTSAATDINSALYGHADEYGVDPSVALSPYGTPYVGIPEKFTNISPVDVYNAESNEVDPDTGMPTENGAIQVALDTCGDGALDSLKTCGITSQSRANQVNYMTDLQISSFVNGINVDTDSGAGSASGTTTTTAGATFDRATLYQDSSSVGCAPGTQDGDNVTGYYQGKPVPLHLCKIPGTNLGGKLAQVNARVSGAILAMITAMNKALGTQQIQITSTFRDMADQQYLYNLYLAHKGNRAQVPGYSDHQMGLAIDFALPTGNSGATKPGDTYWDWLHANAATYGYSSNVGEAWHWSADGK